SAQDLPPNPHSRLELPRSGSHRRFWQTGLMPRAWRECVAASPGVACQDEAGRVWDLESGQDLLTLPAQSREVGQAAFTPDGRGPAAVGSAGPRRLGDGGPPGAPLAP